MFIGQQEQLDKVEGNMNKAVILDSFTKSIDEECSRQCCGLLQDIATDDQERRNRVKTLLAKAFSIIPEKVNILNERDTGLYFHMFCSHLGLKPQIGDGGAQVELTTDGVFTRVVFLFEFTFGKCSYDALRTRVTRTFGKYLNWRRIHVFGVNYNPKRHDIDEPLSLSYAIPYNKPNPECTYCPSMFRHEGEWEYECASTSDIECHIQSYRICDSECKKIEEIEKEWTRKCEEGSRKRAMNRKEMEETRKSESSECERKPEQAEEAARREEKDIPLPFRILLAAVLLIIITILMKSCLR